MVFILIMKNFFFLLKNCVSILNLIKNKNLYYLIIFFSIYLFILPNVAFCETADIEKPEISEMSIEERRRNKIIDHICVLIMAISFVILWLSFLDYMFDSTNDSDFSDLSSDSDETFEVKEPHEPYVQGPGHHFFVRDMGIKYDEDLEKIAHKLDPNNPVDMEIIQREKAWVEELHAKMSKKS